MAPKPVEKCWICGDDATNGEHMTKRSDLRSVSAMVNMFKPFFHGEVRLFRLAELPLAKDWITGTPQRA
jgi:hypothetical protein